MSETLKKDEGTMSETQQQRDAIAARGKVIVSASAGSGKTHVMVRRFVDLVAGGEDVGRMLAVTFTNKASAQMREKIRKSLLERAENASPEERIHLRKQLASLPLADICTIDSFCGRLIRTYFYLLDIDPAFRIIAGEDAEGKALSARALDKTFDEAYESGELAELLEAYFDKRDDKLRALVKKLATCARGEPDYRATLEKMAAGEDLFDLAAHDLAKDVNMRAGEVLEVARRHADLVEDMPDSLKKYYDSICAAAEALSREEDLFALKETAKLLGKAPSRLKTLPAEVVERINSLRILAEGVSGALDPIGKLRSREEERARYENALQRSAALASLALKFDENYELIKREAGVLDYADLEQYALKALTMPEIRASLKYDYVFVDEYQDVNPMQEKLIEALGAKDVFLVGDKKQAIYGFRGSRSCYFTEKTVQYAKEGHSLILSANFRSASSILEAVNAVFSAALPDYEAMVGGSLYHGDRGEVKTHYAPSPDAEVKVRDKVYSVMDAHPRAVDHPVARRVLAIVEEECGKEEGLGKLWYDVDLENADGSKGGMREVRYRDIVVLVRKNSVTAPYIARALSERGIPVASSSEVNVCDLFEGRLLLDWASYLDNGEQDIPMATAMLSLPGGLTEDDLVAVRLRADRERWDVSALRDACRMYAAKYSDAVAQKLRRFFALSERLRALSRVRNASEMLTILLAEGLEAQIAAKGGSEVRAAHVRRLIAESEGCADLHAFLRKLEGGGNKVTYEETEGEDAVHILTVHAAKGLQAPIIILTELDEGTRTDSDDLLWTDRYHAAPKCYDLTARTCGDTLLRRAAMLYKSRENAEAICNVLYVAMTRARYRLHLIFRELPKPHADPIEDELAYRPRAAKRPVDLIPYGVLPEAESAEEEAPEKLAREILFRSDEAHVADLLRAQAPYAHAASCEMPVKDSATGLLKRNKAPMYKVNDEENDDTMPEEEMEDADMVHGFSPEVGIAYHAFLEHVQFGKDAEEELLRMTREETLPPEELALLDPAVLRKILALPCFEGIERKKIFREQRFLVLLPARDFAEAYGEATDDEVIFQGAIDLLIEEGGKFTVVDYKYSALPDEVLREKYAVQLSLYRRAVAKIKGTTPEEVEGYLVNLARGHIVRF